MTISALPTPPLRSDPANFAARADAFLAALPQFVAEANATAAAMNLNATSDTSATSAAISLGAKSFEVSAGKSFQGGMYLVIADTAAPSVNSMVCQVASYSGTTLVVNVLYVRGSGTKASWVLGLSAPYAGDVGFKDGTQAAPGIAFAADPDTGIRRFGGNGLAVVAGGADMLLVSPAGVSTPAEMGVGGIRSYGPSKIFSNLYGIFLLTTGAPLMRKIATLPLSSVGTYDSVRVKGVGGGWTASDKSPFDFICGARAGLTVRLLEGRQNADNRFQFYQESDGSITIWSCMAGYQVQSFDLVSGNDQVNTYLECPVGTPTGTLVGDTSTLSPMFQRDPSGAFLVNDKTNPYLAKLSVAAGGADCAAAFRSASGSGVVKVIGAGETYGGGEVLTVGCEGAADFVAAVFRQDTNGANTGVGSITCSSTNTSFNTTSDYRLKTSVRAADALRFMDIQFRDFEWIDGRHDCGVIAHELAAVYPDLVIGAKDAMQTRTVIVSPAVPEVVDGNGVVVQAAVPAVTVERTDPVYQQVNYSGLIGRMGTVIQQQQRALDALTARVAALESQP